MQVEYNLKHMQISLFSQLLTKQSLEERLVLAYSLGKFKSVVQGREIRQRDMQRRNISSHAAENRELSGEESYTMPAHTSNDPPPPTML